MKIQIVMMGILRYVSIILLEPSVFVSPFVYFLNMNLAYGYK